MNEIKSVLFLQKIRLILHSSGFSDYFSYRWKLNTGCKKSKEERTDLVAVSEKPILTFTIDFETAKRYREANKMPHQFRRAAWTDLTVEIYP